MSVGSNGARRTVTHLVRVVCLHVHTLSAANPTGADGEISLEDEVDMAELLSLAMEILKERDRPLKVRVCCGHRIPITSRVHLHVAQVLGVELDNTLLVTVLSLFGTLGGAVISGLMRFLL